MTQSTCSEKFEVPAEFVLRVLEFYRTGRGFAEFRNVCLDSGRVGEVVGAPSDTSPGWQWQRTRYLSTADLVVAEYTELLRIPRRSQRVTTAMACQQADEQAARSDVEVYWSFVPAAGGYDAVLVAKAVGPWHGYVQRIAEGA